MEKEQVVVIAKEEGSYSCTISFGGDINELCDLIKTLNKAQSKLRRLLVDRCAENPYFNEEIGRKAGIKPSEIDGILKRMENMSLDEQEQLLRDLKGLVKGK